MTLGHDDSSINIVMAVIIIIIIIIIARTVVVAGVTVVSARNEFNQSINQGFFYSGLSNLNHCEVH